MGRMTDKEIAEWQAQFCVNCGEKDCECACDGCHQTNKRKEQVEYIYIVLARMDDMLARSYDGYSQLAMYKEYHRDLKEYLDGKK